MTGDKKVRIGWLKFMYIWTIIIAGGGGLGILVAPNLTQWLFNSPSPQIIYGIVGSAFLAFALLSILGLRNPLKFVPVLLLQLVYKLIWFIFAVLPLLLSGKLSIDAIPGVIIFATFVIGDLIAVPFSNIFEGLFRKTAGKEEINNVNKM